MKELTQKEAKKLVKQYLKEDYKNWRRTGEVTGIGKWYLASLTNPK